MSGTVPTVSTVIPMRDASGTIGRALASLRRQVLRRWEAIVVDDGSEDGSAEVVQRIAREDARVRLVRRGHEGVAAARNAGLEGARGRWVHFLDADDVMTAEGLLALVDAGERGRMGGAIGGHRVIGAAGETLAEHSISLGWVGLDQIVERAFILTHAHVVRRECYAGVRFDEGLEGSEDLDVWARLAERGVRWATTGRTVCEYRLRAGSLSKRSRAMFEGALRVTEGVFARQRGVERAARRADVSEDRLVERRWRLGRAYAAQLVVLGGEGALAEAAEVYARCWSGQRLGAAEAVEDARAAVMYGLARAARPGAAARETWLGALRMWWEECVRRGWADADLEREAMDVLLLEAVAHERVAEEILDRCAGLEGVTIVGFGQNGRLLARLAAARGIAATVRDDRFADGEAPIEASMRGVRGERMDAPVDGGRAVVITPLRDAGLVERFGRGTGVMRWSVIRRALAGLEDEGRGSSERKERVDAAA